MFQLLTEHLHLFIHLWPKAEFLCEGLLQLRAPFPTWSSASTLLFLATTGQYLNQSSSLPAPCYHNWYNPNISQPSKSCLSNSCLSCCVFSSRLVSKSAWSCRNFSLSALRSQSRCRKRWASKKPIAEWSHLTQLQTCQMSHAFLVLLELGYLNGYPEWMEMILNVFELLL